LQDFAAPLLNGNENTEEFLAKPKVAERAWNYCISEEFDLTIFPELKKAVDQSKKQHPDMEIVFHLMKELKKNDFDEYKNFIVKAESRIKPDGSQTLYVESLTPKRLKQFPL
jgi:hypothetical protein